MSKITYKDVKSSDEVNAYIRQGNETLGALGYTDHSSEHAVIVAVQSGKILQKLDYGKRDIELARIAGYLHDIGNCINRENHAQSGALLARSILRDMGMSAGEIALIANAIGHHDETDGCAVNPISAALILADKTDVRRNRVRNRSKASFDKHDRVNYAVTASRLEILLPKKTILFDIQLDEEICSMMDYFEIFLRRMLMCKRAAEILGLRFKMVANKNKIC
ncbi:MAG: HD domain-containing protein [Eubacteriales bacterium]|nr:HD domain-containing protein [Eubacteriales bacterium]